MMNNKYTFRKIITNKIIMGHTKYENNEIQFIPSNGERDREFSLMIGKGYNDLSISIRNNQVVNFNGYNPLNLWIKTKLIIPKFQKGAVYINNELEPLMDGQWYTENWNTYYDVEKEVVCIGDCISTIDDVFIEICTDIIININKNLLKSIWIKNIKA